MGALIDTMVRLYVPDIARIWKSHLAADKDALLVDSLVT